MPSAWRTFAKPHFPVKNTRVPATNPPAISKHTPLPRPRRIDLDASPVEVARRLRGLGGVVFLDSALAGSGDTQQISVVTARPREILRGNIHRDAGRLSRRLTTIETDIDWGVPLGGLFGSVAFNGEFTFGDYPDLLVYDHIEETWLEIGDSLLDAPSGRMGSVPTAQFEPETTRETFCESVRKAREYIAAGDIYQVNLSQRFSSRWNDAWDSFLLYEALRQHSPAPFAAYLEMPECAILSSSPESFLKMSGSKIRTRPIKGTRPRFRNPDADEISAYDLITSQKEIAELIMITDLERNDLGQVCEYGSIHASELLKLERYPQVFHLVSTVEGTLRPEFDHASALQRCFPGGSISGAPKKRALEIIAELESCERGLYTGAIGYFGYNGESQFNIAIRTAVIEEEVAHFHVGAGIVADSEPDREYEETLHKAAGILKAAEAVATPNELIR